MTCKMCLERGKDWNGSDPKCAFDGEFSNNWNCATLNAIRDICYEGQSELPPGVQYQYCEDQKYATILTRQLTDGLTELGICLWLTWYKRHGKTECVYVMHPYEPPRVPTEDELLQVIAAYAQYAEPEEPIDREEFERQIKEMNDSVGWNPEREE